MEHIISLTIGLSSSLLASLCFFLVLFRMKPKIILSDKIAKYNEGGKNTYKFKIANIGRRDAVNLKIEMNILTIESIPDGITHKFKSVSLRKEARLDLPRYSKKDLNGSFAVRFLIDCDIDDEWVDEKQQFLRLKVYAQDSFSGFGKMFIQDYRLKRISIADGQFQFGRSMKII